MQAHADPAQPDLRALIADLDCHPFSALAVHWADLFAQHGRIPRRQEIDPLRFPRLLRYCWILQLEDDGEVRVILSGESLTEWYGFNPMGRTMRDICTPAVLPLLEEFSRRVVREPCIVMHTARSTMPDSTEPAGFIRIGFPIADADDIVRYLAGATWFDKRYYNGKGAMTSEITSESCYRIPGYTAAMPVRPAANCARFPSG